MVFLETTPDVDDSLNTLEQDENLKLPPSKKAKSSQESDAKAALWTSLQARRNWGNWEAAAPPRFLLPCIFPELKKIVLN